MNYNVHDLGDGAFRDRYNKFDDIEEFAIFKDLATKPSRALLNQLKSIPKNPLKPTVFISHRQKDTQTALKVNNWVRSEGFDTWIDVLDPNLAHANNNITPKEEAILIAAIIEMALINCSHVLVVYTHNTKGSNWVPYEYGRVTERPHDWLRSACYSLTADIPEFMRLGVVAKDEKNVRNWLRTELLDGKINHKMPYEVLFCTNAFWQEG